MNIFEVCGLIAINNKAANKSIDETTGKAKGLTAVFANVGKAVAKGVAAIAVAGATAAGALLKTSISAYGEFEQLEGGIKKLFGDDMDAVMANANRAYKTAGLSANAYMSTVTSFSASLIKSLGDDTAAAAKMSDIAIQDMSDNANTFGTDISSLQDAYKNFAKGQFELLDNLSLGYGGSKEEMARLINDSGVMGKNFKATAENVQDISFAKIIEAIHVVQSEMGIAGTTAKEASETIEGSFASWKATWTNLMTGLGNDENVEPLVNAFFDATQDVLKNLGKVLPKIGKNLADTVQVAGQEIKTAWAQNVWPAIQNFFKAKFGIELPAWENVGQSIKDGWNNTVWPKIQEFFRAAFGVELPSWNDLVTSITTLWDNTKAKIVDYFKTIFVVDPEDTTGEAVGKKIREWWDLVLGFVGNIFGAIFAVKTEDENGQGIGQVIVDWWNKALSFIGDIFRGFFRIDTEDEDGSTVGERIKTWWNAVLGFVGNIFSQVFGITLPDKQVIRTKIQNWWNFVKRGLGFSVDVDVESTVHETESGDTSGGGSGDRFATGLDYVPYNDMPARLHYGEAVLTREDASAWRRGRAEDVTILTSRLETAMARLEGIMQQVAVNTGTAQGVYLDGTILAGQLAPRLDAQFGTLTARKGRR